MYSFEQNFTFKIKEIIIIVSSIFNLKNRITVKLPILIVFSIYLILISSIGYSQNKKDIIIELTAKLDSLGNVLQTQSQLLQSNSERLDTISSIVSKQHKMIDSLNSEIDSLTENYSIYKYKTDSIIQRINEYQWFTLQSFKFEEIPKNVNSNCSYSLTKEQFHKGQHIFMAGYEGSCTIKFDDKFIVLNKVPNEYITEGNKMYINIEHNYTVIVHDLGIIETGQDLGYTDDRAYLYNLHLVNIIVTTPLGNTIIFNAYGNCRS